MHLIAFQVVSKFASHIENNNFKKLTLLKPLLTNLTAFKQGRVSLIFLAPHRNQPGVWFSSPGKQIDNPFTNGVAGQLHS